LKCHYILNICDDSKSYRATYDRQPGDLFSHAAFFIFAVILLLIVKVTLEKHDPGCLVTLHQYNIPETDEDKSYWDFGCKTGWNFYLTNLKAFMDHGVDLSNTDIHLKGVLNC
jgi:hypothetical protein